MRPHATIAAALALVIFSACSPRPTPREGAMILVEGTPDATRLVLAQPGESDVFVISKNLAAAAEPVLSPDASRVVFAGKQNFNADWQIYEYSFMAGTLRQVTSISGGARSPALLANGDFVFSSPASTAANPSALYAQSMSRPPRRLTFGSAPATDPTVLRDGRILFVSSVPNQQQHSQSLFTINSDGTELTIFALRPDVAPLVRRPRQLNDGRVAFLASTNGKRWHAEFVHMARPFRSRAPLAEALGRLVTSVEPANNAAIICTAETLLGAPANLPKFQQPILEALPILPRQNPMGHLSTMNSQRDSGTLLCLDANLGRSSDGSRTNRTAAASVRILIARGTATHSLGTTPLHPDGSFLVQVPSDAPIGFETVDANGGILNRVEPFVWVRPGENRSCVGCHEPYNRSPGNARPIAANFPPVAPALELNSTLTATSAP